MEAIEMRVNWNIGYGNMPDLHALLDEPTRDWRGPWRLFKMNGGNFLVSRLEPVVRFVFESDHGGGALGQKFELEDGSEHVSKGGWSSNAGQVNHLRAIDERFAEYLPFDVVDVIVYKQQEKPSSYNQGWGTGMAGVYFDKPWVEAAVDRLLPGVRLLDLVNRDPGGKVELEASAEQAAVIGGPGASAYGYIPVPADWDGTREGTKASPGSELFERTATDIDKRRVAQIAAREATKKGA